MSKEKVKKNKRNAVLYKEMTVDMKKPKIMIIMLLVNLLIVPIAAGFFLGIIGTAITGVGNYRLLAWYLITLVYFEGFILLFITPAITAGSISLEKERQTLDVLLTTRMTPWEIVWGKYSSSLLFLSLMVLSTFPLLALVFIYGGISLIQLFYIGLMMFIFIAFISSFGILFSALTKNTIASVILTYVFLIFYFTITIMLPFVLLIGVALFNEYLYYDRTYFSAIQTEHFINGDILMLTGTWNPILMFYDTIGNTIGYQYGELGSTKGLVSLCGTFIMPHFTEKNILMKLWTPISMVQMVLLSFVNLKLAAALLNPVKGKGKKRKIKKR